jgi:hypothetical protein
MKIAGRRNIPFRVAAGHLSLMKKSPRHRRGLSRLNDTFWLKTAG